MAPRLFTNQSGSTAVEFALLLTFVLLPLLGGIYGYGRALAQYETLTKATRDGARLLSIASKTTINSVGVSKATQRVVDMAKDGGMPSFSDSNVIVTCLAKTTYADSSCADGTEPGGVRVEITGWFIDVGQTVPLFSSATRRLTLKASTTMRYMHP